MNGRAVFATVMVLLVATNSEAAKLVVLAVNSGNGTTPGAQPPVLPAGAKGFLLGIDNTDISPGEAAEEPLAFQDLTFSAAHFGQPTPVVQRLAPNSVADGFLDSPNVQFRSQTTLANAGDPIAGSTFAANDSWWWDGVQNGFTLSPVSTGV